jgi:hypothetical protein
VKNGENYFLDGNWRGGGQERTSGAWGMKRGWGGGESDSWQNDLWQDNGATERTDSGPAVDVGSGRGRGWSNELKRKTDGDRIMAGQDHGKCRGPEAVGGRVSGAAWGAGYVVLPTRPRTPGPL